MRLEKFETSHDSVDARPREHVMTSMAEFYEGLFENGPTLGLQARLKLVAPGHRRVLFRAFVVVLIGWVPLAVLSFLQNSDHLLQGGYRFFSDFGVHARSLIAAPLLVIAEAVCARRLGAIARVFLDEGLIKEHERQLFESTVASVRRALDSISAEIIIALLSYAIVAALAWSVPYDQFQGWYRMAGGTSLSLAGWWSALISVPLLFVLILGWIWRLMLWTRFLWLISRLDLKLFPAHPDRVAGLAFIGYSVRAFSIVALAIAIIVAGRLANLILYHNGLRPTDIIAAAVFLSIVAMLFVAPLAAFSGRLLKEWRRGVAEYGGLAAKVGEDFERKWLGRDVALDQNVLEVSDFSTMTDLNSVVANVYQMRFLPLDLNSLILLVATMLIPFVPILLMAAPTGTILEALKKLLI